MDQGILIIGDEILNGRRIDRHFSHAVEVFSDRGLELCWAVYAGDDEGVLVRHFREIRARGDLCFSFGGIGATPDDRTRQSMAAAHEVPLVRHPGAVQEIESRFGQDAHPDRILMADLPQGAALIPNPYNRIPGFSLGHIHCLPGFPEMAWPMLDWALDNGYPNLGGHGLTLYALTVRGAHESGLIELLNEVQRAHPTVKLSSLPRFGSVGQREIELAVRGPERDAARALAALQSGLVLRHLSFGPAGSADK